MWLWPLKMTTQKLLRLLLLLMLTIRNMLTTFWCRFGRWFGHKVKFLFILWAQGFKVWSIFWSWCSGKILKLKFGHCFAVDASCDYEVQDRFGQEFCKNLWSDLKKLLWWAELNPWVRCVVPLALFHRFPLRWARAKQQHLVARTSVA